MNRRCNVHIDRVVSSCERIRCGLDKLAHITIASSGSDCEQESKQRMQMVYLERSMSAILHNHYGRASLYRYALMLSEADLVRKYWCGGVVKGIEDLSLDALNHTTGLPRSAEIHW